MTRSGLALLLLAGSPAFAATYEVGPGRTHAGIPQLLDAVALQPGDVVEVQGGTSYAGDIVIDVVGSEAQPIVFRGIPVGGQRPRLVGGTATLAFRGARDVVLEGFEITGGTSRCIFNAGHRIVVRHALIRDCPGQGILGADQGSGSFTLEYSEVRSCGEGTQRHSLYMQTDEVAWPGSVVRIRHNYIHSGNGGNLLKSRAERTEVHYNWFEGARYHEVELIGPDPFTQQAGWSEGMIREDHEMVGNVLVHTQPAFGSMVRLGGDGTGQSNGRYRLLHNTFVGITGSTAVRLFDGIESLEMHNNVFHRPGAGVLTILSQGSARWVAGEQVHGLNNWIEAGSGGIPAGLQQSLLGSDPGFADAAAGDYRPAAASALRDAATAFPTPVLLYPFPGPGETPPTHQPQRRESSTPLPRPLAGARDIGAFEAGVDERIFAHGFEDPVAAR